MWGKKSVIFHHFEAQRSCVRQFVEPIYSGLASNRHCVPRCRMLSGSLPCSDLNLIYYIKQEGVCMTTSKLPVADKSLFWLILTISQGTYPQVLHQMAQCYTARVS